MPTESSTEDYTFVTPSRKKAATLGFLTIGGFSSIIAALIFIFSANGENKKVADTQIGIVIGATFLAFGIVGALIGCLSPTYCGQSRRNIFDENHNPILATDPRSQPINS